MESLSVEEVIDMGPVEQRELDRRVKSLEDRMNAWEIWRGEVDLALTAKPENPAKSRTKKEKT